MILTDDNGGMKQLYLKMNNKQSIYIGFILGGEFEKASYNDKGNDNELVTVWGSDMNEYDFEGISEKEIFKGFDDLSIYMREIIVRKFSEVFIS